MTSQEQDQVVEIWHNLFRMTGYVTDPALQKRAQAVLEMSWSRLESILPPEKLRLCEKPQI